MAASFFFYDLETSGFNPREARIMQFAGQRTTLDLAPIDEPVNEYITLTDDVLPDPGAILVTGITPQKTKSDGMSEAEFLQLFRNNIATPDTIFVGYNTIRFDNEFMRYLHYRNFCDPYEWHWQDGRSRWDLLDVVRMTRALRPDGIQWPVDSEGKPTNRLELLASINHLDHQNAHDALSDVHATIGLAQLLRSKQPKLFDYLLSMRDKKKIAELVGGGQPFVYSSGKYDSKYQKTTIAMKVCDHPKQQGILVYDLRHDPNEWLGKTPEQLADAWRWKKDRTEPRLPVKVMQFNRCPAVAPLGVLSEASWQVIGLDIPTIDQHRKKLVANKEFAGKLHKALEILNQDKQTAFLADEQLVDAQMYDGFFADEDKTKMKVVCAASPEGLKTLDMRFKDPRLQSLFVLYKARNYPASLTDEERGVWEEFRRTKLTNGGTKSRFARYFEQLQNMANAPHVNDAQRYLLEELRLYGESLMPDFE